SLFNADSTGGVKGGGGDVEKGFQVFRFVSESSMLIPQFIVFSKVRYYEKMVLNRLYMKPFLERYEFFIG
ncbi:hypothetical protein MOA74_20590, partial [Bacillus spizizenii]|nr:hypothetical protein [Bacillus spizizenii]